VNPRVFVCGEESVADWTCLYVGTMARRVEVQKKWKGVEVQAEGCVRLRP
jgi:hypothetical protein